MQLAEWVAREGIGAKSHLMRSAGVAYTTVLGAVAGKTRSKRVALALSAATGGEVSAAEILGVAETPAPRRRRRKAA